MKRALGLCVRCALVFACMVLVVGAAFTLFALAFVFLEALTF